ncbi:uncharacterized protein ARMOST_19608 [Armillaria ostoyae]|uniref:Uncharacterized protein n=1 Tax=Armillaria ostoyae TaxID=47428 RepID=A0A284S517_ARMOS|nr:uncharacterized protein ARMOST_19608 [Armillaria ostoyae]
MYLRHRHEGRGGRRDIWIQLPHASPEGSKQKPRKKASHDVADSRPCRRHSDLEAAYVATSKYRRGEMLRVASYLLMRNGCSGHWV